MPRRAIYTCVTAGYDRVFPPIVREPETDFILFTDDLSTPIEGWNLRPLSSPPGLSAAAANRWHKVFGAEILKDYQSSIYLDGNLRPIGSFDGIFERLENGQPDILVPIHPHRTHVEQEIEACLQRGKVSNEERMRAEYRALIQDGFEDKGRLTENNIIVRNHRSRELPSAMNHWWEFVSKYSGRDQISLPHVIAKSNLGVGYLEFTTRKKNGFVRKYQHFGALNTAYQIRREYFKARSPEGLRFYLIYKLMVI